jgi:hypothetical protein
MIGLPIITELTLMRSPTPSNAPQSRSKSPPAHRHGADDRVKTDMALACSPRLGSTRPNEGMCAAVVWMAHCFLDDDTT